MKLCANLWQTLTTKRTNFTNIFFLRLCDVGLCFGIGEAEAGFDGGADGFGIGTVGLEDAEHGLDIRLFVGKSHKSCHVAIGEHTLLVEHT